MDGQQEGARGREETGEEGEGVYLLVKFSRAPCACWRRICLSVSRFFLCAHAHQKHLICFFLIIFPTGLIIILLNTLAPFELLGERL